MLPRPRSASACGTPITGTSTGGAEHGVRPGALGFVEVHSENFFADGGAALAVLHGVRETHPVSLHGVGLALGSAVGVDDWHLRQLARLVERIEPVRVSDHACFARAALPGLETVLHGADLLPIAFTDASLDILCANVQRVQERLRRPLLVENLSAYVSFDDAGQWPEAEFLARLARRTGCALLLDVNNLVVNALNRERDDPDAGEPVAAACAFIDALPPSRGGRDPPRRLRRYRQPGDRRPRQPRACAGVGGVPPCGASPGRGADAHRVGHQRAADRGPARRGERAASIQTASAAARAAA